MDQFLTFWTLHNEAIIQWLLFVIVILTTLILVRMIVTRGSDANAEGHHSISPAMEAALAKIAEQAAHGGATAVSVGGGGSAASAQANGTSATSSNAQASGTVSTELAAEHKAAIEKRDGEIRALKKELEQRASESDPSQYLSRIKELEGKLAEYEILEDDIADLSLFKEENAKLKAELDAIKGGAVIPPPTAAPATADAPPPSAVAPSPAAATEPTTSQPNVILDEPPTPAEQVTQTPAPPAPVPTSEPTPEPVAEAPQPQVVASSDPIPEPVAQPGQISGSDAVGNVMAEFSNQAVEDEALNQMIESINKQMNPLAIEIDSQKMVDEMAALAANPAAAADATLESEPDMEKMMREVSALEKKA